MQQTIDVAPSSWHAGLATGALLRVSPAQACQAVFVLLAAVILGMTVLPAAAQAALFDYGARDGSKVAAAASLEASPKEKASRPTAIATTAIATLTTMLERGVAAIATTVHGLRVPHAWFTSFYALYLALALFWALQWWAWEPRHQQRRNLFGWIVQRQVEAAAGAAPHWPYADDGSRPAVVVGSLTQLYVVVGLEMLQAARRLYEHLYVFRSSGTSTMSAAHLALGWAFYGCMSVAVWVEGSQTILQAKLGLPLADDKHLKAKLAIGGPLFLACWLGQFWCHAHLASLKKYTLPDRGLFRHVVCPHYTLEMLLYLALSILDAPPGRLFSLPLLSCVLFIVAGLGVTADRTKKWYSDKFGAARVAGKSRMLPPVF